MMCKLASRSPLRRRKNYACFASILLLCTLAWLRLAEFDTGFSPLRPLLDAESEARRLLAFMTHYNYQCNTTAGQIGNWTLWPVCVGRESGLNIDSKDSKLMYTIGAPSEFNLERTLAQNHSFDVYVVTRHSVWRGLQYVNSTRVIRTTIVANDPADFSRNSFAQRTLNDLLTAQGHGAARIDLLRLVATDSDVVSMSDLVHFLVVDDVLKHVQQLHLTVYIDKLDEDYLYSWYRTLYRLFSKSGFHLFHTSSHDTLCLQVTLMQSCVYFLAYVRNPGPRANTMQPPADFGTVEQEWSRLQDHISTVQVDCKHSVSSSAISSSSSSLSVDSINDILQVSCHDSRLAATPVFCYIAVFSSWRHSKRVTSKLCSVLSIVPLVDDAGTTDINFAQFKLSSDSGSQTVTRDGLVEQLRRRDGPSSVVVDVPGMEFSVVNLLLSSDSLQNTTQLLMYVELPDVAAGGNSRTHPAALRSAYSVLRRAEAAGLALFMSRPIAACRRRAARHSAGTGFFQRGIPGQSSAPVHRCYWLGFTRRNLH